LVVIEARSGAFAELQAEMPYLTVEQIGEPLGRLRSGDRTAVVTSIEVARAGSRMPGWASARISPLVTHHPPLLASA
jgi:hypothetical protein